MVGGGPRLALHRRFSMSSRTEASKPGDDPTGETGRSAQRRRHLRNSPRVHHPVASKTQPEPHCTAKHATELIFRGNAETRNDAKYWVSIFLGTVARMQRSGT